jgi:transposase
MPQREKPYNREDQDGRIKLSKKRHCEVQEYYKETKSQRKTAKHFNVSRGTIRNIINPTRYKAQLRRYRNDKHSKKYYKKDLHKKAMKKYRLKKRILGYMIIKTKPRNPMYKKIAQNTQSSV